MSQVVRDRPDRTGCIAGSCPARGDPIIRRPADHI